MFILYLDFTRRIRKNFTPWYLLYFRNKKMPEQFEGPRGKKRVPGGYEGARKKGPNQFEGAEKKECPREVVGLLLRHFVLLNNNVIDKLFSF